MNEYDISFMLLSLIVGVWQTYNIFQINKLKRKILEVEKDNSKNKNHLIRVVAAYNKILGIGSEDK